MAAPLRLLPDALVLGVGGVVGEAWTTGVLAGMEDEAGLDFRDTEYIVGTSAGAIVAANLTAGRRPRRPDDPDLAGASDGAVEPGAAEALARSVLRWSLALSSPVVLRAQPLTHPTRALSRAALLALLTPRGRESLDALEREIARLDAHFDGRLRVCASDRRTGRRIVFGAPGAPRATVAEAVAASCAIPGRFRPVRIGERELVDGGAWSPTNLDAAPVGEHAEVLCLNPTGSLTGGVLSRGGPVVLMSRTIVGLEAMELRRRGVRVRVVHPDQRAAEAMGVELMDPAHRAAALAAGYQQGREIAAGAGVALE